MEKRSIGSFIAVLRKAKGLTQKQLAEQLNVSDKAISRWERDEAMPDLTLIPVLADIFGVSSDELLRGQRNVNDALPPQAGEKSKKQLKYLLDKAKTDYQIKTLICIMVALLGLIVAAILNLGFLRAVAGFWVGCLFFLVAAALQAVFAIQAKGKLNAEEFDAEALSACKKTIGSYNYWSFAAIVTLFSFTLPLAQTSDVYWGLSLRSWLGTEHIFQPAPWVLAAASLLRLYLLGVFKRPKVRLLLKTSVITLVVLAVTFLGISLLYSTLLDHRHWTGQGTAHKDAESYTDYMQQPLDAQGQYCKYEVIEEDVQGNPRVVRYYDLDTQAYRKIWSMQEEWKGSPIHTLWLNQTVRYQDLQHSDAIYTYTDAQLAAADRIIACIVHPLALLLVAELVAAALIYRKKAKALS